MAGSDDEERRGKKAQNCSELVEKAERLQGVRVRRCPLQSSVRARVLQEVGGTLSPSISLLG